MWNVKFTAISEIIGKPEMSDRNDRKDHDGHVYPAILTIPANIWKSILNPRKLASIVTITNDHIETRRNRAASGLTSRFTKEAKLVVMVQVQRQMFTKGVDGVQKSVRTETVGGKGLPPTIRSGELFAHKSFSVKTGA